MTAHRKLRRFIQAFLLSALAGAVAYGLVVWLAPMGVSAWLVAAIIAAITGFSTLIPESLIDALSPRDESASSTLDPSLDDADSAPVNPATGLPMMGGLAGLDAGGNPRGSNIDEYSS